MSKVRIYDLAKEFGLKSKELADKLIAMGYPIASHSSSVDEDMAADMRRKLQGEAAAAGALAHRIAGATGNVGGDAMRQVAMAMETAGREGDSAALVRLLPEMQGQFSRLKTAMEE